MKMKKLPELRRRLSLRSTRTSRERERAAPEGSVISRYHLDSSVGTPGRTAVAEGARGPRAGYLSDGDSPERPAGPPSPTAFRPYEVGPSARPPPAAAPALPARRTMEFSERKRSRKSQSFKLVNRGKRGRAGPGGGRAGGRGRTWPPRKQPPARGAANSEGRGSWYTPPTPPGPLPESGFGRTHAGRRGKLCGWG